MRNEVYEITGHEKVEHILRGIPVRHDSAGHEPLLTRTLPVESVLERLGDVS